MTEEPKVRIVASPEGETLPFIADRLHSEGGMKVPQSMLFPSADMLVAAIASIQPGALSDLPTVRSELAERHGAASTCPVTTQRLLHEIAGTAVERWALGDREVPPFWRVVDPSRPNAARLPGGADFIRARQQEEGR